MPSHPAGEPSPDPLSTLLPSSGALLPARVPLDLHGQRVYVEWDPHAPVTPLGQLVYFSQFLATAGLFGEWVADCPLHYTSPNAPERADVLGTILLSILAGNRRYAHVTALRGDTVNPQGLGMSRVMSEDAVRRAFQDEPSAPLEQWQQQHLLRSVEPVLREEWICDLDVTIKTVYGRQEGGQVGYNPHKPGRAAHAYHTFFISRLRLALDVVVAPGKEFHSRAVSQTFWPWWDKLPASCRPKLVRADCGFGNEHFMLDCESHGQPYLFRLRQSRGGQRLIERLSRQGPWNECGQGWQGREDSLRLQGWSRSRRVIVLRRRVSSPAVPELTDGLQQPQLMNVEAVEPYEYTLLGTNTDWELAGLARLYRERADSENTIDELKRQWGWGGFVTKDLLRCQVAARNVALIYNWWSLFVRCVEPQRPREAVTSRPLMLSAIGREVRHAGQTTVVLTSTHAEASRVQRLLTEVSLFLSGLRNTAEQLSPARCWERIWERILTPFRILEAASRTWFGQLARLPA
ncbi:MAG: transposase [Verrucomicrobiae bacterium]|nr:transposase [Verrucomicrobiae bacterium]MCW5551530.1 transposase [Verrucomicrobiae bacterium]